MSADRPITEEDLHSYIDDALDPIRRSEVQTYLDAHPDVARRISAMAAQHAALRAAFAPIVEEPVPVRLNLTRMIESHHRSRGFAWRAAAASATALLIGALAGWFARGLTQPPPAGIASLAQEAATSYRVYAPDGTRPVEILAADSHELVRWVSDRLQRTVAVPNLDKSGYRFMGGRLVATPHGPAALFLYDDVRGTRLAVVVRPMTIDRDAPMSEHSDGSVGGITWANQGLGYSLVAQASPRTLHPLANEVRRQTQ